MQKDDNKPAMPLEVAPLQPALPSIVQTLVEESAAGRREFDVRIFYRWTDYDPADEPVPLWGAQIEDLKILEVRHFDPEGNAIDEAAYATIIAWNLLEDVRAQVTEACTSNGAERGVGTSHPLFVPLPTAAANAPASGPRMAPSIRVRKEPLQPRFLG